jgi:hypothetical protein
VTERMYSEHEVSKIALDAAKVALAEFAAQTTVSIADAAKRLDVSTRTIHRMKPPRIGDRIPYSWVMKKLEG